MRCRTILALTGAAVCIAVTGCTTSSHGQPLPQPTGTSETTPMETSRPSTPRSTSPSGVELPTDGAPKVKNPLDTSRYRQDPCRMLTAAQFQELNLPPQGEPRENPLGLTCDWLNEETGGSVGIGWTDKDPRGLSAIYKANKAGSYAYFVELPEIEGYPAVASSTGDARDQGGANVQVGVSDEFNFYVSVQLSLRNIGQRDPVEAATQVAGMAVRTMKAGG